MISFLSGWQHGLQDRLAGWPPGCGTAHLCPRADATKQAAKSRRCNKELPDFATAPQAPAIAVKPFRISGQIDEQTASD